MKFFLKIIFLLSYFTVCLAEKKDIYTEWVNNDQFGLMAECVYAKDRWRGLDSSWHADLLRAYFQLLNLDDQQLKQYFDTILHEKKLDNYFDATIFFHKNYLKSLKTTALSLKKNGLSEYYLDAMALQYCTLKKNTYISLMYPCIKEKMNHVRKIFEQYGVITHEKKIRLSNLGPVNLIRVVYEAGWIGDNKNNYLGARRSKHKRFKNKNSDGTYTVRVILFECDSLARVRACKEKIRSLFNYGPWPIHINDTHQETMALAHIVFCKNSIAILNKSVSYMWPAFHANLIRYKEFLENYGCDKNDFCIVGEAVDAVLGLREAQTLSLIHIDDLILKDKNYSILIDKNSDFANKAERHAVIVDPKNYFYYKGLKFLMPR